MHALARVGGARPTITEDLVSDLIRSNVAASRGGGSAMYHHVADEASLTLYLDTLAVSGMEGVVHEFEVGSPDGVLELQSPLARALVLTEHGLVLSATGGTFTAGPNTLISAENIEIGGELFEAFGTGTDTSSGREMACFMWAYGEVKHDAKLRVSAHPPSDLVVSWPEPWHQWKPYVRQSVGGLSPLSSRLSQQVLLGLRRILTGFQASARDDPSAYCDKFERLAVGTNPVFQATLSELMRLGIVSREGSLYRLRLESLSRFRVNYAALQGSEFAATLQPLLTEVAKSEIFAALDTRHP